MSRNCPGGVLSNPAQKWDNLPMNELIETLKRIGLPAAELERVKRYYKDDLDGLRQYVLYMRALFDDRHEYLA